MDKSVTLHHQPQMEGTLRTQQLHSCVIMHTAYQWELTQLLVGIQEIGTKKVQLVIQVKHKQIHSFVFSNGFSSGFSVCSNNHSKFKATFLEEH